MTEVQMIVRTMGGELLEGIWESTEGVQGVTEESMASGLQAGFANGYAVPLVTADGVTVIPAHAVAYVTVRTREESP